MGVVRAHVVRVQPVVIVADLPHAASVIIRSGDTVYVVVQPGTPDTEVEQLVADAERRYNPTNDSDST
jgi:hypothetical protein